MILSIKQLALLEEILTEIYRNGGISKNQSKLLGIVQQSIRFDEPLILYTWMIDVIYEVEPFDKSNEEKEFYLMIETVLSKDQ